LTELGYRVQASAQRDLRSLTDYLLREAGSDVAIRFVECARTSFAAIGETPGIGPPVRSSNPRLVGLRKWRVDGFPNILIFYRPSKTGVQIIRALHTAQDWWSLLDIN
jgi:toxin ParE1/3/4